MRFPKVKRNTVTISAAIFVVALLLRVMPMGLYVTPDEPIWVMRSLRFYDAVTSGNLTDIPQTGHPGMTTMLFGAVSIKLNMIISPQITEQHTAWLRNLAWLAPENDAAFPRLYYVLPTARWLVALTTSFSAALFYLILVNRLGKRTAGLAALFVAVDPFLTGLSGLLHTDALQASFGMLALALALPRRAKQPSHAWYTIVFIALCLALSGLSKSLGWLIAPGAAFVLLFTYRGKWWQRLSVTAMLTLATLTFLYILYPPMWNQPVQAFQTLISAVGYHEDLGLRDVFFLGEMRTNPGWLFYPLVLLFRLMPPVLVGLFVGVKRSSHERKLARWLWVPVILYVLVISIATKKFDRYVVSLFPMLAMIAAVNLQPYLTCRWVKCALLPALLLPLALTLVLPLYFANPLLGGPWLAQQVIPLGWGEGSGLAANKLNAMQVESMMTDNVPGAASFFRGKVFAWDDDLLPCVAAYTGGAYRTDETETISIAGIPVAYITPKQNLDGEYPQTDFEARLCAAQEPSFDAETAYVATFDGNLDLLAYHISTDNQAPDALSVMLRWLPQGKLIVRDIYLVLHGEGDDLIWDQGGMELISTSGWRADVWPAAITDAEAYIPLDLTLPPGTYRVGLRLIDQDGNFLGITNAEGSFIGVELDLGDVKITAPRYTIEELDLAAQLNVSFDGGAVIGHSVLSETHYAGDTLHFELGLSHDGETAGEPVIWRVACEDGTSLSGDAFDVDAFNAWPAYHRYILRYAVDLPGDMPNTQCSLVLEHGNQALGGVGTFEVLTRERDFDFDSIPGQALDIRVGDFAQLVGVDVPVAMDASLGVALYWSVVGTTTTDYTVFIQLVGPNGAVVTQIDAYPVAGSAPTSTWIPGQAVYDMHTLMLPADLPAGEYKLITGMYDAQNGTRVPLYDGKDRLDGDYVVIQTYVK